MKKVILCSFLIFLLSSLTEAQVKYIAHRGESYQAPENTMASVKLAWKLNDDAVEIDIRMSRDNRIMVIHDSNTQRTSGQNREVKNSKSGDIRKLDAGSFKNEKYKGQKIPYLEEIIRTVPRGKKLLVEIKCTIEVLPVLGTVVEKCKNKNRLVFIAFDWQTIVEAKKMFPDNLCYWISKDKDEVRRRIDDTALAGIDGLDLKYSVINEEVMDKARQLKLDVWAWTVDDPDEANRLIKLGVTGITSNRPAWLKRQIQY